MISAAAIHAWPASGTAIIKAVEQSGVLLFHYFIPVMQTTGHSLLTEAKYGALMIILHQNNHGICLSCIPVTCMLYNPAMSHAE